MSHIQNIYSSFNACNKNELAIDYKAGDYEIQTV